MIGLLLVKMLFEDAYSRVACFLVKLNGPAIGIRDGKHNLAQMKDVQSVLFQKAQRLAGQPLAAKRLTETNAQLAVAVHEIHPRQLNEARRRTFGLLGNDEEQRRRIAGD